MTKTKPKKRIYVPAWLIYALAQIFYWISLAPTVLWGDSANFQRLAYTLNFQAEHNYSKHLLWALLAHPFTRMPIGDVAFRVNLFTSIWAALAVAFVFSTLKNLTRSLWAALAGAFALMVSHNFWLHAVRTEVYSFNLVCLAIGLYGCSHPKATKVHCLCAAIAMGLAVTNHAMMWVAVLALAILIASRVFAKKISYSLLLVSLVTFALCVLLLEVVLPTSESVVTSSPDLEKYIPRWKALPREAVQVAVYWLLQFPSPALFLIFFGLWCSVRNMPLFVSLVFLWTANVALLVNINFADKYVFYLLSYFVGAIWVGLGTEPAFDWLRRVTPLSHRQVAVVIIIAIVVLPPIAYTTAPQLLPRVGIDSKRLGLREIPERPALAFFLSPWTRDYRGAQRFAENILISLPLNATIVADYTVAQPMIYLTVIENIRPDVNVAQVSMRQQQAFVREHPPNRPLFLALLKPYYDIDGISQYYDIEPQGPPYRLVPLRR